jgi:hypothetical protein
VDEAFQRAAPELRRSDYYSSNMMECLVPGREYTWLSWAARPESLRVEGREAQHCKGMARGVQTQVVANRSITIMLRQLLRVEHRIH